MISSASAPELCNATDGLRRYCRSGAMNGSRAEPGDPWWGCSYDGGVPTTGRTRRSGAASLSLRLIPAYVAAIVLGILGMHALAQHCPAPSGESPLIGASISPGMPLEHAHLAAAAAGTAVEAAPKALVAITADLGGGLDDLLMLCAAMLVGAGATLALLLRKQGSAIGLSLRRLRDSVPQPAWLPTATGPPAALAFAVIRC